MVLFEVHLAPGVHQPQLITKETARDTQAQVMTPAEAAKVGFKGLPESPPDHEIYYIATAKRDERRIQNALEGNDDVSGFKIHEID